MSSPKDRLGCRSVFVQGNELSSWDDREVELGVILGIVVGDGVEGIGEGEDCI